MRTKIVKLEHGAWNIEHWKWSMPACRSLQRRERNEWIRTKIQRPAAAEKQNRRQGTLLEEDGQLLEDCGRLLEGFGQLPEDSGRLLEEVGQLLEDRGRLLELGGQELEQRGQVPEAFGIMLEALGNHREGFGNVLEVGGNENCYHSKWVGRNLQPCKIGMYRRFNKR